MAPAPYSLLTVFPREAVMNVPLSYSGNALTSSITGTALSHHSEFTVSWNVNSKWDVPDATAVTVTYTDGSVKEFTASGSPMTYANTVGESGCDIETVVFSDVIYDLYIQSDQHFINTPPTFRGLTNLEYIQIFGPYSILYSMTNLFDGDTKLRWIKASNVRLHDSYSTLIGMDTHRVKNMDYAFRNNTGLYEFHTDFNTDECESIVGMFMGDSLLEYLSIGSAVFPKLKYATNAFNGCSSLYPSFGSMTAPELIDCLGMFEGCTNFLSTIDLQSLCGNNIRYMNRMFYGVTYVTHLYLNNLHLYSNPDTTDMFTGCYRLFMVYVTNCDDNTIDILKTALNSQTGYTWTLTTNTGTTVPNRCLKRSE